MQNPTDEDLRGYLYKKGARFRGWKKRYFVANNGVISYYKNDEVKTCAGSFPVTDATICLLKANEKDGINGHRFGITPSGSDRCYTLQHKELEVRDMWTAYVLQHGGKWAAEDTIYRGYLWKKGNVNTQWKRRYFVVEKGELRWFEDAREKKKQGSIDVSDALVCVFDPAYDQELYEREDRPGFLFSIKPKKLERTFLLESDSKHDLEQWLRLLPPQLESMVEKQICTLVLCVSNRIGRELLIQFAQERACDENVLFWLDAEAYRNLPRNPECLVPAAEKICERFIRPGAEQEIGFLSSTVRTKILADVKSGDCQEDMFLSCQKLLFHNLDQSLFPDFRASPLYQQALKKLGEEEMSVINTRSRVVYEGAVEYRQELKLWRMLYLVATVCDLSFFTDSSKSVMVSSFSLKGAKAIFLGEDIYLEEGKTIPTGFPFGISFFGENKTRVYQVNRERMRVAWLSAFKEIGLEMIDSKNMKKEIVFPSSPTSAPREIKEEVDLLLKSNMFSPNSPTTTQSFLALIPPNETSKMPPSIASIQASNLHDLFEKMTVVYSSSLTKELLAFSSFLRNTHQMPTQDSQTDVEEPCLICKESTHKTHMCFSVPSDELLDLNRIRKMCEVLDQPTSVVANVRAWKCMCGLPAGTVCLPMVVKSLVQCGGDLVLQHLWRQAFNGPQNELTASLQRWTMRLLWLLADFTASLSKCWGGKKVSIRVPQVEMTRLSNAKISALYYIWRDDGLESKFLPKKLTEIRQFYDSLCELMKSTIELPILTKAKKQLAHETAVMVRLNVDTLFEALTNPKTYPLILCQEKARELLYGFLQVDVGNSRCTPDFFAMNVTGTCLTYRKEKALPTLVLDVLKQILCGIALPKQLPVFWQIKDWVEEEKKEVATSENQKVTLIKEPFVVPLLFAAAAAVNTTKAVSFLYDLNHLLIVNPINSKHVVRPGFASWFIQLLFYGATPEEERERERATGTVMTTLSPLSMLDDNQTDEDGVEKNQAQDLALNPIALTINILVLAVQYHLVNYSREPKAKPNPLEPASMASILTSIVVRIGSYKMPSLGLMPTEYKPWSMIHVKLIQKLVGGIVGKLPASFNQFKFQDDHPGWTNLFEALNVFRNLTWIPIGASPENFRDNIDEETVLRSPIAAHLKSSRPPLCDYQEARILLTESSVRGILIALKTLKLFDIDLTRTPVPGEKASDLNILKNTKGEGLANIAYFADCLQIFKTASVMSETKMSLSQPIVAFSGESVEVTSSNQSIVDRIIAQFFCSYYFDRSYSKEMEERLQAFENYRAWSRGLGRSPGFNANPGNGPITEDMKLMYMMALGIPVYTLSPKKVKQCLLFLKEKEPSVLTKQKKEEEQARVYRYNIVLEHRRKKTIFPLAEGSSVCQVQAGVKMEERLVECGLEYASGIAFSISQPKKKFSLDCICLSWDTYNAWMRGLIRLLKEEPKPDDSITMSPMPKELTRSSVSHTPDIFCDCTSTSEIDPCKVCGRQKESSMSSSLPDLTSTLGSVSPLANSLSSPKAIPPKPPRKVASENSGSRSSLDEL